jgi:hypothetical protein
MGEWMLLMQNTQLEDEYPWLTERAKQLAYCRSKAPCTNPFNDMNSFKKMSFCEFIEAVVRVTYTLQLVESVEEDGYKYRDINDISKEDVAELLPTVIKYMASTLPKKDLNTNNKDEENGTNQSQRNNSIAVTTAVRPSVTAALKQQENSIAIGKKNDNRNTSAPNVKANGTKKKR